MKTYTNNYQIFKDLEITLKHLVSLKLETIKLGENDGADVFLFRFDSFVNLHVNINTNSNFNVPVIILHEQHSLNIPLTLTAIYKEDILEIAETIVNIYIPQTYQDDTLLHDTQSKQITDNILNNIKL